MLFTLFARSSSFERPSGLTTALSKSNSTSAAYVTFSATGLGFASGFGSGLGAGAGAATGAGAGAGAGSGAGLGASCVAQAATKTTATRIDAFLIIFYPPENFLGINRLRDS